MYSLSQKCPETLYKKAWPIMSLFFELPETRDTKQPETKTETRPLIKSAKKLNRNWRRKTYKLYMLINVMDIFDMFMTHYLTC